MNKPFLKRPANKNQSQNTKDVSRQPQYDDNKYYGSIIPGSLLTDYWQRLSTPKKRLWYPLDIEKFLYPRGVEQILNSKTGEVQSNGNIFWCYRQHDIIIWQYENNNYTEPAYMLSCNFDLPVTAAYIAEVQSQMFTPTRVKLLALAFGSCISLYKVTKTHLQSLQIQIYTLSLYIQKLLITNEQINQSYNPLIIFCDTCGDIGTFNLTTCKKNQKRSLYKYITKRTVKQKNEAQVLQVLRDGQNIYCLIKRFYTSSLIWKFLKKIFGEKQPPKMQNIIEVYSTKLGLKHQHSIYSSVLSKKIKQSFQQFLTKVSNNNVHKNLYIHSIYIENHDLKIIMNTGYCVTIRNVANISFHGNISGIPILPANIGIGIQLNQQIALRKIRLSEQNFFLVDGQLLLEKDNARHAVKIKQDLANIIKLRKCSKFQFGNKLKYQSKWFLINKNYLIVLKKLRQCDVLLIYATIYNQMSIMNELTYDKNQIIQKKFNDLALAWGYPETIAYIIELLAQKNYFEISIKNFIYSIALRQISSNNIISEDQQGYKKLRVNEQIEKFFWKLIEKYKIHKSFINQLSIGIEKSDALWHALMIIFTEVLSAIRNRSPIFFAQNSKLISTFQEKLELFIPIVVKAQQSYLKPQTFQKHRYEFISNYKDIDTKRTQDTMACQDLTKQQSLIKQGSIKDERQIASSSTQKLCKLLLNSIPKIKLLMQIYQSLAQCDKKNIKLPKFQTILWGKKQRLLFSKVLVENFNYSNQILLNQIEQQLPQLQMRPIRLFHMWKNQHKNPQTIEIQQIKQANPLTIAKFVNQQTLNQIEHYYKQFKLQYCLIDILLEKIRKLKIEELLMQQRKLAYGQGDYFHKMQINSISMYEEHLKIQRHQYLTRIKKLLDNIIQLVKKPNTPNNSKQKNIYQANLDEAIRIISVKGEIRLKDHLIDILKKNCLYKSCYMYIQHQQKIESNIKRQFIQEKIRFRYQNNQK